MESSTPRLRFEPQKWPIGTALRAALRDGYGRESLRKDVLAGLVVGVVALPLSMALAIASGVPPAHGLFTAAIAGAVAALAGGSRVSVTGPTAAFVVLLAPISAKYGVGGLALASAMSGLLLLTMGIGRMGRLVQFVPSPVVTGFTAGIAVVIATLQLPDALGLSLGHLPEHWAGKVGAIVGGLGTTRWEAAALAALTLATLVVWPKVDHRVPSPLVALTLATIAATAAARWLPGFEVETIGSRFGGVPQALPAFAPPWAEPGADGQPLGLSLALVRELLPSAFAIAMLGAIESLLCAVAADGLTGQRHDPDGELVGQGLANLVAPFFGGIAATGAIARTATNVRSGALSPVASLTHAIFVLVALLVLAPILVYLPMAALAGLLLFVAWNMSDLGHFVGIVRRAPRSDIFVLLTCFLLTVIFDMTISVSAGVVLAALLFMRRMAEVSDVHMLDEDPHRTSDHVIPPGVRVYVVSGPLFFGAAEKAVAALGRVSDDVRTTVLDLAAVPVIDATGLVNLESAVRKLERRGVDVIISSLQAQPRRVLEKAGWFAADHGASGGHEAPKVRFHGTLAEALDAADPARTA